MVLLCKADFILGLLLVRSLAQEPLVRLRQGHFHRVAALQQVDQQAEQAGAEQHAHAFQDQPGLADPATQRLHGKAKFQILGADG